MNQSVPWHVKNQSPTVEIKKERDNIYDDESTKRNVEGESVVYQ